MCKEVVNPKPGRISLAGTLWQLLPQTHSPLSHKKVNAPVPVTTQTSQYTPITGLKRSHHNITPPYQPLNQAFPGQRTCHLTLIQRHGHVEQSLPGSFSLFRKSYTSTRNGCQYTHSLFSNSVIFCVDRPILSLILSFRVDTRADEDKETSKGWPTVGRTRTLTERDRERSLFL